MKFFDYPADHRINIQWVEVIGDMTSTNIGITYGIM